MQISTETWSRGLDRFLNSHKSPSTAIYISLFLSSLLSLPTTNTRHGGIAEKLKTCDREESESEYAIWQLCDYANWETCQILHTARIKFEFGLFISRNENWNQISMNAEFISPLMK